MNTIFNKTNHTLPIDFLTVKAQWQDEGFSFGIFRDSPGQEWNDFRHSTDEYVLVAEGQLRIDVGEQTAVCEAGDLVRIPRDTSHSLKTLSDNGSVWLYGYGSWEKALG
jgi:cupin 2 domain-containing protein